MFVSNYNPYTPIYYRCGTTDHGPTTKNDDYKINSVINLHEAIWHILKYTLCQKKQKKTYQPPSPPLNAQP